MCVFNIQAKSMEKYNRAHTANGCAALHRSDWFSWPLSNNCKLKRTYKMPTLPLCRRSWLTHFWLSLELYGRRTRIQRDPMYLWNTQIWSAMVRWGRSVFFLLIQFAQQYAANKIDDRQHRIFSSPRHGTAVPSISRCGRPQRDAKKAKNQIHFRTNDWGDILNVYYIVKLCFELFIFKPIRLYNCFSFCAARHFTQRKKKATEKTAEIWAVLEKSRNA